MRVMHIQLLNCIIHNKDWCGNSHWRILGTCWRSSFSGAADRKPQNKGKRPNKHFTLVGRICHSTEFATNSAAERMETWCYFRLCWPCCSVLRSSVKITVQRVVVVRAAASRPLWWSLSDPALGQKNHAVRCRGPEGPVHLVPKSGAENHANSPSAHYT
jgi:hypothetical protein